jgi:hypothetical protein
VTYIVDPSMRNRSLVNACRSRLSCRSTAFTGCRARTRETPGSCSFGAGSSTAALLVSENCKAVQYEAKRWLVAKDEKTAEESTAGRHVRDEGPGSHVGPDPLSRDGAAVLSAVEDSEAAGAAPGVHAAARVLQASASCLRPGPDGAV